MVVTQINEFIEEYCDFQTLYSYADQTDDADESLTLILLHDAVLPKLIFGELRITRSVRYGDCG
jgi:hypothetical protein